MISWILNHTYQIAGDSLGGLGAVASVFVRFTATHRSEPAYIWCTLANSLIAAPIYAGYRKTRRGINWFRRNARPILMEE